MSQLLRMRVVATYYYSAKLLFSYDRLCCCRCCHPNILCSFRNVALLY
jgi:hypothetical protein